MRGATEPQRRRTGAELLTNAPVILFGGALLTSGVLLVSLGSRLSWQFDDWTVLLLRPGWTVASLLDPHYEHITVSQIAIYKVLLDTFGMDSLLPFSVVGTIAFLLSAVLVFVYLRSRVGDWLALMSTTVILFLGAAWEDLLWPIAILLFGTIACGLGMLLALQREDRIGDRLACVLLVGSMSFFSHGLAFAAGAAVDVAQRRELWRSRIYIVAIPSLLYAVWWLGWGHTADTSLSPHDFGAAPRFVLDAIAAGFASLLGLAGSASVTRVEGSLDWGRAVLPIVLLLAGWRIYRLERVPRFFWIVATIAFSTWILAALGSQAGRPPEASRYQYASAIFILLMAAELFRGVRVGRNALIAGSVLAATSLLGNVTQLSDAYEFRKLEVEQERAALGAVEIARDRVPPTFDLPSGDAASAIVFNRTLPYSNATTAPADGAPSGAPASTVFTIRAGAYLEVVDDFGSPAYSPPELAASSDPARAVADRALAAALGIKLASNGPASPSAGPRPTLIGPREALEGSNANCLSLNAPAAGPPLLELPTGGATVAAGESSGFQVRLRRFATATLPVDLGVLPAHTGAVIDIPTDRSTRPWYLSLDGTGRVDVCGRPR